MKTTRGMLWAAAATVAAFGMLAVGTVTVVGVNRDVSADEMPPAGAELALGEASGSVDSDTTESTTANALGVEQYRGGGSHGGGSRGGGSSHSGGSRGGGFSHGGGSHAGGFSHGGGSHASRGGYGHGYGRGGGWGSSRWGRWGGGRYVGGRWVGGPYYGWCDSRFYDCAPYWW